jgi:APA family basic amino acid/polyamine antiporter
MALLVLFIDLSGLVVISTFAMLFYYASANISAIKLKKENRMYPQIVPFLGTATCIIMLVLILLLSPQAWIIGIAGLAVGSIYYVIKRNVGALRVLCKR